MNYKHFYLLVLIFVVIIPLILSVKFPNISTRFFIYSILFLSILVFEAFRYNVYIEQEKEFPEINKSVKVKIIAGFFKNGVFNSIAMNKFVYPRITNDATVAYGNTNVPSDLVDRIPRYPLSMQLFDYLFLKFLNHCFHNGWSLIDEYPLETESIKISPKINTVKSNNNIFDFEDLPFHIKEHNIYFKNNELFFNGEYVDRKTISILYHWHKSRPFGIVLPPETIFKIEVGDEGWPTMTYLFTHKLFMLKLKIEGLVAGPGYPQGFHLRNEKKDYNSIFSTEMILNFKCKFKKSMFRDKEIRDFNDWANRLLNYFRFYFDYEIFEEDFQKKTINAKKQHSNIVIIRESSESKQNN